MSRWWPVSLACVLKLGVVAPTDMMGRYTFHFSFNRELSVSVFSTSMCVLSGEQLISSHTRLALQRLRSFASLLRPELQLIGCSI